MITKLSDIDKLKALASTDVKRSIGVIVSPDSYSTALELGVIKPIDVEFLPGFPGDSIDNISSELCKKKSLIPNEIEKIKAYQDLSDAQRKWIKRYNVMKDIQDHSDFNLFSNEIDFLGISVKPFEYTQLKTVAIELFGYDNQSTKKHEIETEEQSQLLRAMHHCYDSGKKKLIIINRTKYSHEEFLSTVFSNLAKNEQERSTARFNDLLQGWSQ